MRQPGEITRVTGNMLEITFCRPEACATCNACEGGKREHVLWVQGEGQVGDIAVVEMPDTMVTKASAVAYGMPLLCLLAGLLAGSLMTGGRDLGAGIGAAVGLAAGMILLKATEKRRSGRSEWKPQLVEVLPRRDGGEQTAPSENGVRGNHSGET